MQIHKCLVTEKSAGGVYFAQRALLLQITSTETQYGICVDSYALIRTPYMLLCRKLQELQDKISECEMRLRRLESLSKIVTQHVETSSYECLNADNS